jgi:hypothetical protein
MNRSPVEKIRRTSVSVKKDGSWKTSSFIAKSAIAAIKKAERKRKRKNLPKSVFIKRSVN